MYIVYGIHIIGCLHVCRWPFWRLAHVTSRAGLLRVTRRQGFYATWPGTRKQTAHGTKGSSECSDNCLFSRKIETRDEGLYVIRKHALIFGFRKREGSWVKNIFFFRKRKYVCSCVGLSRNIHVGYNLSEQDDISSVLFITRTHF